MKNSFLLLMKRDIRKSLSLRALLIWLCLSGFELYFFFNSGGRRELVEKGSVNFMIVFLPQIIFGAWAVMSVYFDLISSDREHNVLDCILCSGVNKSRVFLSKVLASCIVSLLLSLIYLLPITLIIISIREEAGYISILFKYFLPLWSYIMVFAALGTAISVIARSSKAALIWSLASGLILMPRFFMIIVDGMGNLFKWTQATKSLVSMISPGILIEALSDYSDIAKSAAAAAGSLICIFICYTAAYLVFCRQDELNYGE